MPRERLPDRRQAETVDLWHGGQRYHLTVGEYNDGRPGEVFIHGAKPGSDVDLLCDDIGVLMSRLLQHGDDPASLAAGNRAAGERGSSIHRRRHRGRAGGEGRRPDCKWSAIAPGADIGPRYVCFRG